MVFKKLKARMGMGAATVETTLDRDSAAPGDTITGTVVVAPGEVEQEIEALAVELSAIVEVEGEDSEYETDVQFARLDLLEGVTLSPGDAEQRMTFTFTLPFETPVNHIGGTDLPKIRVGVRTKLAISGSVDPSDLDPLTVTALPLQAQVHDALAGLGFRLKGADLERASGPFGIRPELEYAPGGRWSGKISELEVSLVARGPDTVDVIVQADRRDGWVTEGRDESTGFTVTPGQDVAGLLSGRLDELAQRRQGLFG